MSTWGLSSLSLDSAAPDNGSSSCLDTASFFIAIMFFLIVARACESCSVLQFNYADNSCVADMQLPDGEHLDLPIHRIFGVGFANF